MAGATKDTKPSRRTEMAGAARSVIANGGNLGIEGNVMCAMPCLAIRRVVIPLDETALAERGRDVGVTLAETFGAEVLLIRCYSERTYLPSGSAAFGMGMTGVSAGQRPIGVTSRTPVQHPLHAALAYLEQTEAEIARAGLIVRTEAVQWPPSFAIAHLANRPLTDLVVMVTHLGEIDPPKPISGSITREVIEHISPRVPVLLLPVRWVDEWQGGDSACSPGAKDSRPLVVALVHQDGDTRDTCDGSRPSEFVRSYAELFAQSFEGTFTEGSMSPDAAGLIARQLAIKSTGQVAASRHFGMFVIGGIKRSDLVLQAQYLLRAHHVPVLVVPEM